MKASISVSRLLSAVAIIAVIATPSLAQFPTLYWQGGTGDLISANYSDGTTGGDTPVAEDVVFLGADGVVSLNGPGTVDLYRLRVGHNETTNPGDATLTVSNGALLNLTGGDAGTSNTGLTVGNVRNGLLVIDGPGTTVTSSRQVVIGVAPGQLSRNGTIRLTNGGSLVLTAGSINMGLTGTNGNGMPGHLIVEDGSITALGSGAGLFIGDAAATSNFTMAAGTVQFAGAVEVGTSGSKLGSSGQLNSSSFSISGGTFTNGGNFFVGRGGSANAATNISGGSISVGGRYLMGSGTSTGATTNHSAGTLNTILDVRVGDAGTAANSDATYNLSGTGVINSTTGGIVGRQGTGRFFQTGGQANFNNTLSIGNRTGAVNSATGLYKVSAGQFKSGAGAGTETVPATMALNIAPQGTGEFRVVGDDATIDVLGNMSVGNSVDGIGTLTFEFETDDLLSRINVTDAVTFAAGSKLVLDTVNASPTQSSYDLLTALTIDDQGIDFTAPIGWNLQIVSGGNGQILRATTGGGSFLSADFNQDGFVNDVDLNTWKGAFGISDAGDANNDDRTDGSDFLIWQRQFGALPPAIAASAPATAAVPEPTTLAIAFATILIAGQPLRRYTVRLSRKG